MLKVVTLFSGIDAQCQALDRIGIEYDLLAWADIEPDVITAHNALYPQYFDRNLGDVSKIDWSDFPDFDVMTYSSPCQSFSSSGLQEGGEEGSGTQSSLLWECKRAIEAKHPKYLIFENVKNLMSEKFFPTFQKWIDYLFEQGYTTKYKVINALDYDIPQNRERIIAVSSLDSLVDFSFPESKPFTKKISDVLEKDLSEDVWFDEKKTEDYIESTKLCRFSEYPVAIAEDFYANRPVRIYTNYSPTLRSERTGLKVVYYNKGGIKIRNLTIREAFRFMDVDDDKIDKLIDSELTKTSLLKMAGNSICVGMLAEVFKNLFIGVDSSNALF